MPPSQAAADTSTDIAVLGAGVVGMATAWAAARRGRAVQVLDAADGPAQGASLANGAQLSYAYTDAMAGPALWKQIPSLLLGNDPVFRMTLLGNPAIWRWGLQLLGNANSARLRRNTLDTLTLALESRQAMQALLERHPIEFSQRVAGKLHLYFSPDARQACEQMMALKRTKGVVQEYLEPAQALAIEPALAQVRGITGAVYSPQEEVGDPHRFANGLLYVLQREHGTAANFGFDLMQARREAGQWRLVARDGRSLRARTLVVCAGIDSAAILRQLGVRVPLMAIKGYSFTAPCGPSAPSASITDTSRKLVFCRLGGRMRVAGLADINNWDRTPDPARFAQLLELARQSMPEAVDFDRIEQPWAGLRPATPRSVPMIFSPRQGLVCNVGHGMLGWTLAMGSGERAMALVGG